MKKAVEMFPGENSPTLNSRRDFFQFSFSMRVAAVGRRAPLLQLCFGWMKLVAKLQDAEPWLHVLMGSEYRHADC